MIEIIQDYDKIDKSKWSAFVARHPNGNIFQTPEMYEVFRSSENHSPYVFIAIDKKGGFNGLLVSVLIREKKGVLGRLTARSIIFGGPLILGENLVAENLIYSYNKTLEDKAIYSQVRNFFDTSIYHNAFIKHNYTFNEHLNILQDLTVGEYNLRAGYSRSRKKGIKKATNAGFEFQVSNDHSLLDSFYDLLSNSYSRIKLPFPKKNHFYELYDKLSINHCKIFLLKKNDLHVAALVALQYNKILYGYYMGLTDDINILRMKPSDLFFHEVFKWCIENHISTFDWMGAGKPNEEYGVRDFKLQFGGKLVNFGRYNKIHKPLLYAIGKLGLKIWHLKKK